MQRQRAVFLNRQMNSVSTKLSRLCLEKRLAERRVCKLAWAISDAQSQLERVRVAGGIGSRKVWYETKRGQSVLKMASEQA
jgi:hypothetical protein